MPVKHNIAVQHLTDDEFHRRDYEVMGLAFEAHKELGRMCDEDVYREFMRLRCLAAGLESAMAEVQILLWHEDFQVIRRIEIVDGPHLLGCQRFHLLEDHVAFCVTSVNHDVSRCRAHLQRLLSHTRLTAMHWINLNQHHVTLHTLTRT